jgi:hypothetical protein
VTSWRLRWVVVVVAVVHGAIHLLGVVEGFGWADIAALVEPIGPAGAVLWAAAAMLLISTGAALAAGERWWWIAGATGVVVSQAAIITSWSDAAAGTIANAALLLAVLQGMVTDGARTAA